MGELHTGPKHPLSGADPESYFDLHVVIIIIEHLLRRISITVLQSSCRFTLIDMIINRHIKFNMLKT